MQAATASRQVHKPTRWWRKPDSNPQSLSEKSGRSEMRHIGFRVIWPAQAGTDPGGGPEVRIRLPPAGSPLQTRLDSLTRIDPTDVLPSRIPLFRPWRIDGTGARDRAGRAATGWPRRGAALRRRRGPNSPFPKMLDAAILASQTEGIRGMAAKAADLGR